VKYRGKINAKKKKSDISSDTYPQDLMNDDMYPPSATDAWLHERRRLTRLCPLAHARADSTFRLEAQRH